MNLDKVIIWLRFTYRFLGGGVLNTGCVQEEIRFVICPELMLSMLFTEMLKPNEALMIIGKVTYIQTLWVIYITETVDCSTVCKARLTVFLQFSLLPNNKIGNLLQVAKDTACIPGTAVHSTGAVTSVTTLRTTRLAAGVVLCWPSMLYPTQISDTSIRKNLLRESWTRYGLCRILAMALDLMNTVLSTESLLTTQHWLSILILLIYKTAFKNVVNYLSSIK